MSLQRLLLTRQLVSRARCNRLIHQSAVAQKKKRSSGVEVDDLFGSGSTKSDELFSSTGKIPSPSSVKGRAPAVTATSTKKSRRLGPEERLAKFSRLHAFVSDRVGLKPVAKTPEQVRKTAWQHLFSLATTREQLESVAELFSKWRDSRRVFEDRTVAAFIRRCEELHCSDLALKVFSNHSKYGFPLTSLAAARHLMHSLHVEHPLSSAITLVALYKVYNLPPVSTDLISASMLASACFRHNTTKSIIVAHALVPSLQKLIEKTPPTPVLPNGVEKAKGKEKEKAWLTWTLAKIERALEKQKLDYQWLRDWREKSGHLSISA